MARFVGMARVMTRHRIVANFSVFRDAALSWIDPLFPTSGATTSREQMRPLPPLALLLRRRRQTKRVENEGPAKPRRQQRLLHFERPYQPEAERRRAIRAAWAVRDWWTLKAFGEIDAIPEP